MVSGRLPNRYGHKAQSVQGQSLISSVDPQEQSLHLARILANGVRLVMDALSC
jgi:hypothetical protein